MIEQVEMYHGAMLARLCRDNPEAAISIRQHESINSAYVVSDRVALYVKYSTKRMSPWSFSFQIEHQSEIRDLRNAFEVTFVILVCGTDGMVCLTPEEYSYALDCDVGRTEWIKARRNPREKYTLTGSDSRSSFKVGDNEFPARVLSALEPSF